MSKAKKRTKTKKSEKTKISETAVESKIKGNLPVEKESGFIFRVEWIGLGFAIILLILSLVTAGFTKLPFNMKSPLASIFNKSKTIPENEAKEKALKYINETLLQGQQKAEIKSIEKDSEQENMYKIKISINGQEFDSYVSTDGKFLYTDRYEIKDGKATAGTTEPKEYPKTERPVIEFYTMSYCPYGNQAEDMIKPVADILSSKADFNPHYVIYSNYAKQNGAKWNEFCFDNEEKYCSMHGIQELNQNLRERCVFDNQKDKFWSFVMAANSKCNYQNVDSCWEQVAKDAGVDTNAVKSCFSTNATKYLEEDKKLNTEKGVQGSPTIFINGAEYTGNRTPEDFKNAVCSAFSSKPAECDQTLESTGSAASGSCN